MASVTLFNAARTQAIEDNAIVDGLVDTNGNLILLRNNGAQVNAGSVIGPQPDLATSAETIAGTRNDIAVSPAGLTSRVASQAETQAGNDASKTVSPATLKSFMTNKSLMLVESDAELGSLYPTPDGGTLVFHTGTNRLLCYLGAATNGAYSRPAGWYPISGIMPRRVWRDSASSTSINGWTTIGHGTLTEDYPISASGIGIGSNAVTLSLAGWYTVRVHITVAPPTGTTIVGARLNHATLLPLATKETVYRFNTFGNLDLWHEVRFLANSGTVFNVQAYLSGGGGTGKINVMDVKYDGPS